MTLGAAERFVRQKLESIYDGRESSGIAAILMEHLTGLRRIDRITRKEQPLTDEQEKDLQQKLERLLRQEPVQYVLQEAPFYGMMLFVDEHVLIPRPETEELVEWIISDVKAGGKDVFRRGPAEADRTEALKILDIGTGSGCIALALKKEMPKAEVWGCDTSDAALNIARRNGALLDIRVDFVGLDFLQAEQRKQLPTVDIIVSNPPYIPFQDQQEMHPNVLKYEPHLALFVPDNDALVFYRALAAFGYDRLYPGGSIYAEIHESLGAQTVTLFEDGGYTTELRKDLQGKDRMIKAVKK